MGRGFLQGLINGGGPEVEGGSGGVQSCGSLRTMRVPSMLEMGGIARPPPHH